MCGFSQGCDKTSVKREFQRGAVTLGLVTRCFPVLRHESLIFLKLSALWRYLTRILVTLPSGCLRRSRRAVGRERRPSRTKQLCYRFHSHFSLSPFSKRFTFLFLFYSFLNIALSKSDLAICFTFLFYFSFFISLHFSLSS